MENQSRLIRISKIVIAVITIGAGLYKISKNPQDWTKILAFMLVAIIISTIVLEFIKLAETAFMKNLSKLFGIFIIGMIIISLVSLVFGWPKVVNRNVSNLFGLGNGTASINPINFNDGDSIGISYNSSPNSSEKNAQLSASSRTSLLFKSSRATISTGYFNIPIKLDKSYNEISITIPQSPINWGTKKIGNPSSTIFELFLFTEKPKNISQIKNMSMDNKIMMGSYGYDITNSDPFRIPKIEEIFDLTGVEKSEIYLIMKFSDGWEHFPISITIKDLSFSLK